MKHAHARDIWDPTETTNPGVGGLADPDPLVMLGKVAADTAKNTKSLADLSERFDDVEAAIKDDSRRTRRLTIIVVVAIEVLARLSPGLFARAAELLR